MSNFLGNTQTLCAALKSLVFLGLLSAQYTHAKDTAACVDFFSSQALSQSLPQALVDRGVKSLPIELDQGGRFFKSGENFSSHVLEQERHVYLIDDLGNITLGPRFQAGEAQKYQLSHRSLRSTHLTQNPNAQFVASGEIVLARDKLGELYIKQINNRSGTYWGDESHLTFAQQQFQARGAKVSKDTIVQDFSKKSTKGTHIEAQLTNDLLFTLDPKEYEQIRTQFVLINQLFAKQGSGSVDPNALVDNWIEWSEGAAQKKWSDIEMSAIHRLTDVDGFNENLAILIRQKVPTQNLPALMQDFLEFSKARELGSR